jgi:nitrate/nitrite transporter NarK
VLLALALGASDFAVSACWATPVDIAPRHAGVMTGFMNSVGNIGGLVAPLVVGYAVNTWGSWTIPFYISTAVYTMSALAWLAIDPTKPIEATESASAATVWPTAGSVA